jgi:hypothetical protein
MNDRRSNAAPIAIAALLLLLPCLYVGSYFALVKRVDMGSLFAPVDEIPVPASYRLGGEAAKLFYAPANWADRRVRRAYWLL